MTMSAHQVSKEGSTRFRSKIRRRSWVLPALSGMMCALATPAVNLGLQAEAFSPNSLDSIRLRGVDTVSAQRRRICSSGSCLQVAVSPFDVSPSNEARYQRDDASARNYMINSKILNKDRLSKLRNDRQKQKKKRSVPISNNLDGRGLVGLTASAQSQTLLSAGEEIQYTQNVRTLQAAVCIRDELVGKQQSSTQGQPSEYEWAEACGTTVMQLRRVMFEGQKARSRLVSANVGLVTSIAKRQYYALKQATEAGGGVGTILTLQDMIQEGNMGLVEAAERFDPEKGVRFSTYATFWVRQRILRSISDYSRIIRLPAHVHSMLTKINRARKTMKQNIGRNPSVPELAQYLEISEEQLDMYTQSSRNVVSLELPLRSASFKEDRRTIGDNIVSDAPTPEEDAQFESLRRDIRAVIDELPEQERDVLVMRFGLNDGKQCTVGETAKLIGLSRDRVRLVEARALNKLRHPQRNYRLKDYLGSGSKESEAVPKHASASTEKVWFF